MFLPAGLSLGAGFIHAIAAGTHAEHPETALLMATLAAAQCGGGIALLSRARFRIVPIIVVVQLTAIAGWLLTRTTGITFIYGLAEPESIQIADGFAALLAFAAVVTISKRAQNIRAVMTPVFSGAISLSLVVPALLATVQHQHSHGDSESHATSSSWPRPFFPGLELDLSGVEGVSQEQEARAHQLVVDTQTHLVRWADYQEAVKEGWISIGDSSTGYEHFVNGRTLNDGRFLDAEAPESIVYKVYGDKKILVSAMYMAEGGPDIDAPILTDFAGPLMQWHIHDNLCWSTRGGVRVVAGVTDQAGNCPSGSIRGGITTPMVHVWIVPHPCGPFAAVEGLAEGRASVPDDERVDTCDHDH